MKLPKKTEFIPGYYLATFNNGSGSVMEDPRYDQDTNTLIYQKVAIDGVDSDGGEVYIGCDELRMIEPISRNKVESIRTLNTDRGFIQRIQTKLEAQAVLERAKQTGLVQMPANNQQKPVSTTISPPGS